MQRTRYHHISLGVKFIFSTERAQFYKYQLMTREDNFEVALSSGSTVARLT
jgi:hypothetical protein